MQIYDSFGPNPRALRMFLLEKGIELPKIDVDLLAAENRRGPYLEKNPGGQVPALVPTARSAIVLSSVSPDRCEMIVA